MLTLFFTSLALAMDAVAVSIAIALQATRIDFIKSLKVASIFGLFQAGMPLLGYLFGNLFSKKIAAYDHWIAFAILLLLGLKMIRESFDDEEVRLARRSNPFQISRLLVLGLATSLDAFAIGISFSLLHVPLFQAVFMIGVVCFLLCLLALQSGRRLGLIFSNRAELFGGAVLILIGLRILYQHLSMA